MIEYKSELICIENTFSEKSVTLIDKLVNKKALEGWELVAYVFEGRTSWRDGLINTGKSLIVTFKRNR